MVTPAEKPTEEIVEEGEAFLAEREKKAEAEAPTAAGVATAGQNLSLAIEKANATKDPTKQHGFNVDTGEVTIGHLDKADNLIKPLLKAAKAGEIKKVNMGLVEGPKALILFNQVRAALAGTGVSMEGTVNPAEVIATAEKQQSYAYNKSDAKTWSESEKASFKKTLLDLGIDPTLNEETSLNFDSQKTSPSTQAPTTTTPTAPATSPTPKVETEAPKVAGTLNPDGSFDTGKLADGKSYHRDPSGKWYWPDGRPVAENQYGELEPTYTAFRAQKSTTPKVEPTASLPSETPPVEAGGVEVAENVVSFAGGKAELQFEKALDTFDDMMSIMEELEDSGDITGQEFDAIANQGATDLTGALNNLKALVVERLSEEQVVERFPTQFRVVPSAPTPAPTADVAQKPTTEPDLLKASIEEIAKAAIENPNDVNAALLVFAAAGTRPASLPGQETKPEPKVDSKGQLQLFQLPETHTPIPEAEIPTRQEPASDLSYSKLKKNVAAFKKIVGRLISHHIFRIGDITDLPMDVIADRIMKQMVNNILFVYDSVPEVIRTESKKWYKGANRIARMWSQQYGVTTQAVAGVIASLSPQKDWFQNVSLAERVLDIWTGDNRVTSVFGPEMEAAAAKMDTAQAAQAKGKDYIEVEGVRSKLFTHAQRLKDLVGRDFDSLGIVDKAFFIRLYDETYNSRSYSLITPDGRFGKEHINKDGSPTKIAWGTVHMTASAVAILEDPSLENISIQLGHAHKIRSFYNNIINPDSDQTVTSDTHAVAVAYMMPLSGASREVTDNFGGITTEGYRGTYAFIAEAYRKAAKKRGVKPSEMQSVTWEAIRDIFPAAFKRNKGKVEQLREAWNDFSRNRTKQSYEKIRQRAYEAGGGYSFPQWYQQPEFGFGDNGTAWDRTSTYTGNDRGNQPDGLPAGTGRRSGRASKGTGARTETGRAPSAEQRSLFQDGETRPVEPGPKGTYTPKAAAKAAGVAKATLGLLEGKSDASTGIHEAGHAIEDFLEEIGEGDKAEALRTWAKENGKTDWREQREFIARGFERFVVNGVKTGVEVVAARKLLLLLGNCFWGKGR